MPGIYKVLTLNIKGIRAASRIGILEDCIRQHEVDIVLLQEVVSPQLQTIRGYATCRNIGTNMRELQFLSGRDFR
jgi:exonuclease III